MASKVAVLFPCPCTSYSSQARHSFSSQHVRPAFSRQHRKMYSNALHRSGLHPPHWLMNFLWASCQISKQQSSRQRREAALLRLRQMGCQVNPRSRASTSSSSSMAGSSCCCHSCSCTSSALQLVKVLPCSRLGPADWRCRWVSLLWWS